MKTNVGGIDKIARIAVGLLLIVLTLMVDRGRAVGNGAIQFLPGVFAHGYIHL